MLIAVIVVAVLLLYIIIVYNGLIRLRNRVANAWAQIDVELRRRFDLIPRLVEVVKGYAAHEKDVLTRLTEARSKAAAAGSDLAARSQAEDQVTAAFRQLFAVVEAYPDLKANTNFLELQNELAGTERRVAFSRQFYNDTVMMYHTRIEVFPANIIAGLFGFQREAYFQLDDASQREMPDIDFSTDPKGADR